MAAAIVNILLGLWVMIAPAMFDYNEEASNNSYVIGPLVITFAITSIWEVNRNIRYANVLAGLWLAASPFVLEYSGFARYNHLFTGIAIAALSFIKGKIENRYGGGWKSLFEKHPFHEQEEA